MEDPDPSPVASNLKLIGNKGNKLISIIELWIQSKQGNKTLNEWLTYVYNLVEACNYDSSDRIIRDVLIIGCESDRAKDKIIQRGETITLNETIEILQTEASTNSTLRQFSGDPEEEIQKRKCFRCGAPYIRKHLEECKAKEVTYNGCGIKGHLKKCCKKSGNFPKDTSNRQNQSPSTGPGRMNIASTLPQIEADFSDEKGLPKQYRAPVQQYQQQHQQQQLQQQYQHTGGMFALRKIPITSSTPSSVSDQAPDPVPTPDFPFQEFPLTEVVNQSQIVFSSISDTLASRECSNSTRKAPMSTDSSLKSVQNCSSNEEMRENRDLTISTAATQSSRDSSTISITDNSTTRKSIPGIMAGTPSTPSIPSTPSTFPVDTDVTEAPEEIQAQSSNNRSVMPTDIQALTVLQSLVSDDFQVKNTPSTQRKREDTRSTQRKGEDTPDTHPDTPSTQRKGEDEAFQRIQKIHNQLQQFQWDLQRLHSLHKYKN